MRRRVNYHIITICCVLLIFSSCKKEDAPENPCGKLSFPNARILMDQAIDNISFAAIPGNDTLTIERLLQFRSEWTDTNTYKHLWYIGIEKVTDYKVSRDFSFQTVPQTYTVHHVMRWEPHRTCNPLDKGYDSSSFTFTITNKLNDLRVMGKYRIVLESSPNDSIDIEFYFSKFGYPDSLVKNPLTAVSVGFYDGDVGPAEQIELRVKGLLLYSRLIHLWLDTKGETLDAGHCVISDCYIRLGNDQGSLSMGDGYFSYDPKTNQCAGTFYHAYDYYKLKGRKL